MRMRSFVAAGILLLAGNATSLAAKLNAADRAWIDTCIAQRAASREKPAALRKYCVCMQRIVEDNTAYTITDLERAFPPAHRMCWTKAGRRTTR